MAVTLPSQASLGGGGVCLSYDRNRTSSRRSTSSPDRRRRWSAGRRPADRHSRQYSRLLCAARPLRPAALVAAAGAGREHGALRHSRFRARSPRSGAGGRRARGRTAGPPDLHRAGRHPAGPRGRSAGSVRSGRRSSPGCGPRGPASSTRASSPPSSSPAWREAGGSLDRAELAQYQPVWRRPLAVGYGDRRAFFAPPPTAGGVIAGQMWAMLVKDDRYRDEPDAARDALLVDTADRRLRRPVAVGRDGRRRPEPGLLDLHRDAGRRRRRRRPAVRPGAAGAGDREPGRCNPGRGRSRGRRRRLRRHPQQPVRHRPGRDRNRHRAGLAARPGRPWCDHAGPDAGDQPTGGQFVFAGAAAGGVLAPTSLVDVAARALLGDQTPGRGQCGAARARRQRCPLRLRRAAGERAQPADPRRPRLRDHHDARPGSRHRHRLHRRPAR